MKSHGKEELFKKIKECREFINFIRREASKDSEYGFDLPWDNFIQLMSLLNPQSYGSRIQNRFLKEVKLYKMSSRFDRGDCRDVLYDQYEVKCSIIDDLNTNINLVQIRLWQKTGFYVICVDTRVSPFDIKLFVLSKNEMSAECELLGAAFAHGNILSNKNNENKELRMSIPVNREDPESTFNRWCRLYLSNFSFR